MGIGFARNVDELFVNARRRKIGIRESIRIFLGDDAILKGDIIGISVFRGPDLDRALPAVDDVMGGADVL